MAQRTSPLRQLADLISQSVAQIDDAFDKAGLDYPSLDAPFNPVSPLEALSMSPHLLHATKVVTAACAQLSATVSSPPSAAFGILGGMHVASSLRAVLESHTVEILREHPEGLNTTQISELNGVDASKLARILRLLSTHHIFREVSPDVFCNNRISSMMDTGKSVKEILADPVNKHIQSPSLGAVIEHSADEVFKGDAFLSDVLQDSQLGSSEAPEDAATMVAVKYKGGIWKWFEEPENEYRFKRFSAAMAATSKAESSDSILHGFKWGELPAGSVVVDVGGGMGHHTLKIAKAHPHLKCIVQDRPAVMEHAKNFWAESFPSAIADGSVELQAHDFFSPQPVRNATIFWARAIIHDYGKIKATEILKHLRAAAQPDTRLVLIDAIVPYACLDDNVKEMLNRIPGSKQIEPPQPLLANFGKAGATASILDLQMLVAINGEERTLGGFIQLASDSGWKIVEVIQGQGSHAAHIVAVPL